MVLREGREFYSPRQITTNISFCFGVVRMISLTRIQMRYPGFYFRDVIKHQIFDHSFCHIVAKLFNLFSDVFEEGVAGPAAYHHDNINRYLVQGHCHSGSGAQRVCSNLGDFETKLCFPDCFCRGPQRVHHFF